MKFHLAPASADFSYAFYYREPYLDLYRQDPRIDFVGRLLKEFAVGIDALKLEPGNQASKVIQFSKFYDRVWFNVSIGIERFEVILNPFPERDLLKKNCTSLYNLLGRDLLLWHEMTVHAHFLVEEGLNPFLESLNPNCPPGLTKFMKGRGVSYDLELPEHELVLRLTVANSVVISSGAYVGINARFASNRYSFEEAFEAFSESANKIAESFNIEIKKEN